MRKNIYVPDELNMKLAQLFTKSPDLERKFNPSKIIQEGIEKFIIENSNKLDNQQDLNILSNIFGIAIFKDDEVENTLKNHAESIKNKDLFQYENLRTYIGWDIYRRVTKIYHEVNKQEIPYNELEKVDKEEESFNKKIKKNKSPQDIPSDNQYSITVDDKLLIESINIINKTYPDYMHHLKMVVNEEICKTIDKIKNEPLVMSIPYNNTELYKNCPIKPKIKVKELSDHDKKRLLNAEAYNVTEETDIINAVYCSNCKINLIEGSNLCLSCAGLHDR